MAAAKAKAKAAVRIVGEGEGPEAATAEALIGVVRLRGLHPTLFVRKDGQGLGLTGQSNTCVCVSERACLVLTHLHAGVHVCGPDKLISHAFRNPTPTHDARTRRYPINS